MAEESTEALLRKINEELAELPPRSKEKLFSFHSSEVRDIIIATVVLILAFTLALNRGFYIFIFWNLEFFLLTLEISAIGIATGFIGHELSHKFVAQHYGFKAHFQILTFGVVLAIVTAFMGFLFAAPGAVYVEGEYATKEQIGKISSSGAIVNIGIATGFLFVFLFTTGMLQILCYYIIFLNAFLAFFNLLPIEPLDGYAVYMWNKIVLVILMAIALTYVALSEIYVFTVLI